jgi:hypothetical protein
MDADDVDLTGARNGDAPTSKGYDMQLQPKSDGNLKAVLQKLRTELQQAEGRASKEKVQRVIDSVLFHMQVLDGFTLCWGKNILPLDEASVWSATKVQLAVIKVVKYMWKKHGMPLHLVVPKLYNKFAQRKKKSAGSSVQGENKRARVTDDTKEVDSSRGSAKKSKMSPGTKGKGKGKGKESTNGKGGGRGGKGSRPSKVKATSSKAATKRLGSDNVELRTGGARLGDPVDYFAAGTIVDLDPTVSGGSVSFDDYVLARFMSIISGKENMKLTCDVYEVFFFFVLLLF